MPNIGTPPRTPSRNMNGEIFDFLPIIFPKRIVSINMLIVRPVIRTIAAEK